MGVVYKAYDPALARTVAVKLVRLGFSLDGAQRRAFVERFQREARIAGKLSHPHIVAVHDFECGEEPFLVMEYFPGVSLSKLLEGPLLPIGEVTLIVSQLASALSYAHERGVVHRDIKPGNLLYQDGLLKLVDFGIAKLEASEMTATGEFIGTPSYMSPELFSGVAIDARSDLFSLGVVLYQLLTGVKPFEGGSVSRTIYRVLHDDPSPPSTVRAGISTDWDEIVRRLLAKSPENRYSSAGALLGDLSFVGTGKLEPLGENEPTTPVPSGRAGSTRSAGRGARVGVGVALAVAVLVTLAVVVGVGLLREAHSPVSRPGAESSSSGAASNAGHTAVAVETSPPSPVEVPRLGHPRSLPLPLPLRFVARHEHRIGYCTGDLVLDETGIAFETSRHGTWRWKVSEIEGLHRLSDTELELRAPDPTRGRSGDAAVETFRFTFLRPGLSQEDFDGYQGVLRAQRGDAE